MSPRYCGPGLGARFILLALAGAVALTSPPAAAQLPDFRRCATMEFYPELLPGTYRPDARTLRQDAAAVRAQLERFRRGPEEVYVIPVVIHIVHHVTEMSVGTGANITDEQAISQLQVLNEDFRALLGTPGQSAYPDSIAADTHVEFVLATVDPDGNPTSGITRHARSDYTPGVGYDPALGYPGQFDLVVKPETIWDPERYMNMWSADLGPLLLGYAQFPEGSGLAGMPSTPQDPNTDGVVMNYAAFGSSAIYPDGNYNPPYDTGRTATHEVGHFLGLRHIWGDGDCTVDDFVFDTPDAAESNGGCPTINSCNDLAYGYPIDPNDMVENYMDYTDDACMNTYTEGQKARIRHVLEVSPRRASLVGNDPSRRGLFVEKRDGDGTVEAGRVLRYTLAVTNDSDEPATRVVLTDEIPEGTTFEAASGNGAVTGNTITWALGTLAPGETNTRRFAVRVARGPGSAFLSRDGVEDGPGNWTVDGVLPTWAITTADAYRGAHSWFAQDPDHESDQWLTLAETEGPLPDSALFRFWHRYNTEATFDGGVVEVSTDGGLTWSDLGPHFIRNGYDGVIPLANNPHIGDRPAFHGHSGDWIETVADLSAFAGERTTIRFRFASDVATPGEGWYVDDVAYATRLVSITGTAHVASAQGEEDEATRTTDVLPRLPRPAAAFQAGVQGREVVLSWEGAGRYAVEVKAADGDAYSEVARVDASASDAAAYTLRGLPPGAYHVRVRELDGGDVVGEAEVVLAMAEAYALEALYPNPFSSQATVIFTVRDEGPVRVALYDALGRLVATPYQGVPEPGEPQRVVVDGTGLASGVYVLRLSGDGFVASRRLTLLR